MALWVDALLAYAYAYDKLITSHMRLGGEIIRPNISCTDGRGWPLGVELYSKFHQVMYWEIKNFINIKFLDIIRGYNWKSTIYTEW